MRDYLCLGATPVDEDCAQVADPDYYYKAKPECQRYIELLRQKFGREPEGARLAVKSFPHDYGSYYEVVCYYDDENASALEYAYELENNVPMNWEG